jgi:signal peptidase I
MRALGRWLLWSLIGFGVVVGALRAVALRWWKVPVGDPWLEASVAPTLRGGDWIVAWRLTEPTLGSLVLCPEPKHTERLTIGRLVGEERNTVRVEGTRVTINERPFRSEGGCAEEHFKVDAPQGKKDVEQRCSMEVAHGLVHMRGEAEETAELPVYEQEVGSGEALLISDNRRYPYDSRDFGPVVRETCKETIVFRLIGKGGFFDSATRFQYIR